MSRSPEDGKNVVLTLDAELQAIVEAHLLRAVDTLKAVRGFALFIDPRTGEILASVNAPHMPAGRARNWNFTDQFEPGSTYKVVVAGAALEEEWRGPISGSKRPRAAWRRWCPERCSTTCTSRPPATLRDAVRWSSNIIMGKLGLMLGAERLYRYSVALGFGSVTGLSFPGEAGGLLRTPSHWSKRSCPTIAIGHEVSVTPLQIALAYAAIANGGVLMRPMLAREIRDPDGNLVRSFTPSASHRVFSEGTTRTLREMLAAVVDSGTAKAARVPGLAICGKTGTAQKYDAAVRTYGRGMYLSSFVGFAPAANPIVVGVIVIDEPRGKHYYGGEVAAPVFREIVLDLLRLPHGLLEDGSSVVAVRPPAPAPVTVPDLRLLLTGAAEQRIADYGLRVHFEGAGPRVLSQDPAAGVAVERGARVTAWLAAPTDSIGRCLPDLTGMPAREALRRLAGITTRARIEGSGWSRVRCRRRARRCRSKASAGSGASPASPGRSRSRAAPPPPSPATRAHGAARHEARRFARGRRRDRVDRGSRSRDLGARLRLAPRARGRPVLRTAGCEGARRRFRASGDRRRRGAAVIATEAEAEALPVVRVREPRKALAQAAARFYGYPSRELRIVGVTGTNGKTTTTYLVHSVFTAAGIEAGLIGTTGYRIGKALEPAPFTTPEAPELEAMLRAMVDHRLAAAALELSSHALVQRRCFGLECDVAVFTNLSHDHLDYHGTLDRYLDAKLMLFDGRNHDHPRKRTTAVVNRDDASAPQVIAAAGRGGMTTVTFGTAAEADLAIVSVEPESRGLSVVLREQGRDVPIALPLLGRYNAWNAAAAFASARAVGIDVATTVAGLERVPPVPGRLERVGADVAVHRAGRLRPHPRRAGRGGRRDPRAPSRPAAARLRLRRRPRPPEAAAHGGGRRRGRRPRLDHQRQPARRGPRRDRRGDPVGHGRRAARGRARPRARRSSSRCGTARAGDAVLIAGKGHETTQTIGDRVLPFDDRETARRLLRAGAGSGR